MDEEYLTKLADLAGMRFCRAGDYGIEGMREAVVGVRQGYILAIGEETGSRKQSICLFIRFSPTSEETLIDSMKRGPAGLKGRRLTFETEWSEPLAVEGEDDEEPEAPRTHHRMQTGRRRPRRKDTMGRASPDPSPGDGRPANQNQSRKKFSPCSIPACTA